MCQNLELLKPSQILYSKRKTISLIIKQGGEFIVRSPKKVNPQQILDFIEKKQTWILKTRLKLAQTKLPPKIFQGFEGEILPFLGKQITIKYNLTQQKDCIYDSINLVLILNPTKTTPKNIVYTWLQKEARVILNEELKLWAQTMKVEPKQFRLSSAKTRWGSCSGKNVISLNWRLVLTPIEILRYVVIHELAHISQKNHSIHFWNLVARYDQNFKERRKYLKTEGHGLMHNFS